MSFLKGSFQDTVEAALKTVDFDAYPTVLVHFDADLFSSTVFALSRILNYRQDFFAMFDEFSGDEARALYALERAFMLECEWFTQTVLNDRPCQVAGRIRTRVALEVSPPMRQE